MVLSTFFEEIEGELKEYLLEGELEEDSTDGRFNFIENLTNRVQEDFDEIIGDSCVKSFIRLLTRILAILLKTKVDNVNKMKRILKIAISATLKLWSGQN